MFHGWTEVAGGTSTPELHVSTLEPWDTWPPTPGAHFVLLPESGDDFAVANVAYGNVEAMLHRADPGGDGGLMLTTPLSATSPGDFVGITVAADPIVAHPSLLVRGYDTPPVAFNVGYLAMLAAWETEDAATTEHALRLAVSVSGSDILGAGVEKPDDPDLACARGPIAAAGIRSGKSWLVVAGAGSELQSCDTGSSGPPSTLVVDRLAWGPPDAVDWTLERTDAKKGATPIDAVRMAEVFDGGFALVHRKGQSAPDLFRVTRDGKLEPPIATAIADGAHVIDMAMTSLSSGILLAYVDDLRPEHVRVEVRDRDGEIRATGGVDASGPVDGLQALSSKSGSSVLLAWRTASTEIELSRIDCGGGS